MANYLIFRVLSEISLRDRIQQFLSKLILLTNCLVVEYRCLAEERTVPSIFTELKFAFFSAQPISLSNAVDHLRRFFTDGNLFSRQARDTTADQTWAKCSDGWNNAVRVSRDKRLIELLSQQSTRIRKLILTHNNFELASMRLWANTVASKTVTRVTACWHSILASSTSFFLSSRWHRFSNINPLIVEMFSSSRFWLVQMELINFLI